MPPNELVIPEFLHYALLSENTQLHFRNNATGTAGNMPKINQSVVKETPLSLLALEEQTEIVKKVGMLFSLWTKRKND
jgi:type I restriction enzyme S subunit